MTEGSGSPLTLRHLLWGQEPEVGVPRGDGEDAGAGALDERLDRLPSGLRAAAREQIVSVLASVLDRSLVDVLASGWRTWEQVVEAARHSLERPGEVEIVELVDHEITSTQNPHVDVLFDGEPIAEIGGDVGVDIRLHAVTAVVADGRLSALRAGRADVTAQVSVEGVQCSRRRGRSSCRSRSPSETGSRWSNGRTS